MTNTRSNLRAVLNELTLAARVRGMNDSRWAARAGLPKETLSRLRRRHDCDFSTLLALADAASVRLETVDDSLPVLTPDGHFPVELPRDYEEKLLRLCASRSLDPQQWAAAGPRFFMAGLAVMLSGTDGFDRSGMLKLAYQLHPGASDVDVFGHWLKHAPVCPSRFLPMLGMVMNHAA